MLGCRTMRLVLSCLTIFIMICFPAASFSRGPLPSHSPSSVQMDFMKTTPDKDVQLGTWVEYAVTDRQEKKSYRMKIAFVGREGGGRFSWMEISLAGLGRAMILKLYLEGTPGNPGEIRRMIMQIGNMQPMEMPLTKSDELLPVLHQKPMMTPRTVGNVDMRTPAGQFPGTLHVRGINADGDIINFWHHRQALMWSLVKMQDGRFDMELVGQGLGAVSRIRQNPVPFHMPR